MNNPDRERIEELLLEILGGSFELATEKASKIIDVLDAAPEVDQVSLLAFVLRTSHLAPESDFVEKGRKMTSERFDEIGKAIRKDLYKVFHVWIKRNPTEEQLASKVWAYMKRFDKDEERDFLLSVLLRDSHTPYVQIPDDVYDLDLEDLTMSEPDSEHHFRDTTAMVLNLLNRQSDNDALTVALWNIINRQFSPKDKFMIFRLILRAVKKDVEEAARSAMMSALKDILERVAGATEDGGVLGFSVDIKDLPPELREMIEKKKK